MAELDVSRFYSRLGKLHAHFVRHRAGPWNNANCLAFNRGPLTDEEMFFKSIVIQQYLFGYELPDTILVLTIAGNFFVLATKKKCEFLRPAVSKTPPGSPILGLTLLERNKSDNNAENFAKLIEEGGLTKTNGEKKKVGLFLKERILDPEKPKKDNLSYLESWESSLFEADAEMVDMTAGISLVMSIKEDSELDLLKKSSVLSNKVLKHGFIPRIEEIIDSELSVTHEELSAEIDSMIEDPSKIKLKVPMAHVQSCYFPIVQSGGAYDLKISAQSTSDKLKYDIVTVSLGARYQLYCSNICRTFLVDPPKVISETYETLLSMQNACLDAMVPGNPLKGVYAAAVSHLRKTQNETLMKHLPKNLGFSIGLDFRDPALVLSSKNSAIFRQGMVFSLSVGFSGVELTDGEKGNVNSKSAVKALKQFGLLVTDTITVTSTKAEILTKHSKNLNDISYTINDDEESASSSSEEESKSKKQSTLKPTTNDDEAYARSLSNGRNINGQRASARLAANAVGPSKDVAESAADREKRQIALMVRRNEERLREQARIKSKGKNADGESDVAEDIVAYEKTKTYPDYVLPNQVKVDMTKECVILPICGNPIPFHISTIKNVVLPDPDTASFLRINFFTSGVAVGKDTPANTVKLIQKYAPHATFIREMTFRSLDPQSLTLAYRQILELRKRLRQRELQEQESANLVKQDKLVRTKSERVPRLSDLTMRPVFASRKTQGNLDAHTNGLRFMSTRGETLDIMYGNIKHAIFQPCENEIMVLLHFHLRNPIMVGKKRQKNVQFFTEVIDASLQVDAGRRSMYDPDEMDDEQRERQLRKKLNEAFKDFCRKVENVARKNNFTVEFDIPYRDLGFMGTPHKEMVFVQPTLNCLVNLTETPFYVVDLSEVDHVHFERVTFHSRAFDLVLVSKDFTKPPCRVDMVNNDDKDSIQEWLTDMEITYTEGPMNLNWKSIMNTVSSDDRFYMNTYEDEVTDKDAGWEFLRMFGKDDDTSHDSDAGDSEFSDGKNVESSEDDDDSEEESEFDSESEEESDYDGDDDLEEQGMDWDEMEREAAASDRRASQSVRENESTSRGVKRPGGGNGNVRPRGGGERPVKGRRVQAPPEKRRRR